MKFDSYPRFLRSDVFAECASAEQAGKPLPYEEKGEAGESQQSTAEQQLRDLVLGSEEGKLPNSSKSKRRSFLPWARIKSSLANAKAASVSSMPAKDAFTVATFRRPMMRKLTNSIGMKMRSKSLDEHLHHSVAVPTFSVGASSSSKSSTSSSTSRRPSKRSFTLAETLNSPHISCATDSLDLDPVFSPLPDQTALLPTTTNTTTADSADLVHLETSLETVNSAINNNKATPAPSSPSASSSCAAHCARTNCHLLRISFPDRSQTVAYGTAGETLESLIQRLLQKRNLHFSAFDVFKTGENVVSRR